MGATAHRPRAQYHLPHGRSQIMDECLRLRRSWGCLARCALISLGRCKGFDISKNRPWGSGKDAEFTRPMKLIAVWQDTVMHQNGAAPVRGFGGRVWFYGTDAEKPVKVD